MMSADCGVFWGVCNCQRSAAHSLDCSMSSSFKKSLENTRRDICRLEFICEGHLTLRSRWGNVMHVSMFTPGGSCLMEDLTIKCIDVPWVIAVSRDEGDDLQYSTGAFAAGLAAA